MHDSLCKHSMNLRSRMCEYQCDVITLPHDCKLPFYRFSTLHSMRLKLKEFQPTTVYSCLDKEVLMVMMASNFTIFVFKLVHIIKQSRPMVLSLFFFTMLTSSSWFFFNVWLYVLREHNACLLQH